MAWEARGIRGEWYSVKLVKIVKTYNRMGKRVFNLEVDCIGDRSMQ